MDEIHVHKTKKSICAHFAESPCNNCSDLTVIVYFSDEPCTLTKIDS